MKKNNSFRKKLVFLNQQMKCVAHEKTLSVKDTKLYPLEKLKASKPLH